MESVLFDVVDRVATITINRPDRHNAIDRSAVDGFVDAWSRVRGDAGIDVAIVTGAGGRAFTSGIDLDEDWPQPPSSIMIDDDIRRIGPKTNDCWKPVIAAVNGMACGGALYLLGEADLIVAAETATFFDPHVTHGLPAVFEPMLLVGRLPLGEILQLALLGRDERMSATRARELGFVQRVVPGDELAEAAATLAETISSAPDQTAVGATLKAIWHAHEVGALQAARMGSALVNLVDPTAGLGVRAAELRRQQ